MSVKVIKSGQVKTWVDETTKNIKTTIGKSEVRFDLNLLPEELHKTIDHQTVNRGSLIHLVLGDTEDFTRHIGLIQFWPNGIPKETQAYLEKLMDWLSYLAEKSYLLKNRGRVSQPHERLRLSS